MNKTTQFHNVIDWKGFVLPLVLWVAPKSVLVPASTGMANNINNKLKLTTWFVEALWRLSVHISFAWVYIFIALPLFTHLWGHPCTPAHTTNLRHFGSRFEFAHISHCSQWTTRNKFHIFFVLLFRVYKKNFSIVIYAFLNRPASMPWPIFCSQPNVSGVHFYQNFILYFRATIYCWLASVE